LQEQCFVGDVPLLARGPPEETCERGNQDCRNGYENRPLVGWPQIVIIIVGITIAGMGGGISAELFCRGRTRASSDALVAALVVSSACLIYGALGWWQRCDQY